MKETLAMDVNGFADTFSRSMKLPYNVENQVLVNGPTGKLSARPVFMPSSIVENDTDLQTQKGVSETFGSVFNWWKRISRGGPTLTDTYIPAEVDTWSYDAVNDSIVNTTNSASLVGFISPEKYDDYVLEVNVSSTNGDDDYIGVIAAHAVDKATGLTHVLTVQRVGNGRGPMMIDVNFNNTGALPIILDTVFDGLTWMDGTVATGPAGSTHGGWNIQPLGTNIKVTRKQNLLTIETTQVGSTAYFAPAKRVIDLAADPRLAVFLGPQSFGYTATSQANSTWKVLQRPETKMPIVDTRDWSKWTWANNTWTKTNGTKAQLVADGVLVPEWVHHNATTAKYYYIDVDSKVYRL